VRFAEKLGSGASKDVYRAYDTQEGIEVAWNVVNLSGVPKSERNRIVNEVRLLERLHHHNIISFHGSWVNRERQEVNFVTEILSSGTLKSFINKVQVIRWKIAKRWAVQILQGLQYLHSQDPPVIHRDLKCENIFINGTSGDLRIGDLGLSTVHRNNGRVLSVLGTPEFMAPDMYEEQSYDEKVDIYAFGMCLLEIFTKEIPYRECMNPAQIYKKVSSGELPEVLTRLESRNAREFILLCLGHKDEATGRYVRPSAAELLQHPFLEKRASDDHEVIVNPPLFRRSIAEGSGESDTSPMGTPVAKSKVPHTVDLFAPAAPTVSEPQGTSRPELAPDVKILSKTPPPPPPPQQHLQQHDRSRAGSLSDNDGDTFDEMPQSETQVRKVKVLMGRGRALEEDDDHPSHSRNQSLDASETPVPSAPPTPLASATGGSDDPHISGVPSPVISPPFSQPVVDKAPSTEPQVPVAAPQHYLVAAAVIENESSNARPYPDDVLKLVVTLPVEGHTQNVQFDFHLVEDDPVQVAKEMVQELGIPQGAVLEISETISGLACAARIKIEKYNSQKASAVGIDPLHAVVVPTPHEITTVPVPSQTSQPLGLASRATSYVSPADNQVTAQVYHRQGPIPTQLPHQQPQQQVRAQPTQPVLHQQRIIAAPVAMPAVQESSNLQAHMPPLLVSSIPVPSQVIASHGMTTTIHSGATQAAQVPVAVIPQTVQVQPIPPVVVQHESIPARHGPSASIASTPIPVQSTGRVPDMYSTSHLMPTAQQPAVVVAPVPSQGHVVLPGTISQHAQVQTNSSKPNAAASLSSDGAVAQTRQSGGRSLPTPTAISSEASQAVSQASHARYRTSPDILPAPSTLSQRATTVGTASTVGSDESDHRKRNPSLSSQEQSPLLDSEDYDGEDEEESDTDPTVEEELRKLEEEFERSMQRVKKVFDSRMDNLQRSQIEREAQHQKTLEKHEKERAEFEKRLAQEEEQQVRRMEHLQREWEKKRQALAQQSSKRARQPPSQSSSCSGGAPANHNGGGGMHQSQESFDSHLTIGSGSVAGGTVGSLAVNSLPPLGFAGTHRRQTSGNMSSQTLPTPQEPAHQQQPSMNGGA
jgi:WNK lysine deficient protein kinase